MTNINDIILYANIKGENGREVREARIVELNERPCYFYFNKSTRKLDYVRGCGICFMLEIAGIGEVSSYKLLNEYKGGLYKTLNLALRNDEEYSLFIHGYNENILNIGCIADISYDDLNFTHSCTTLEFEYVRVNSYVNTTHFRLKPISYYWDGTQTKRYEIHWKFKFDLIDNKIKMYKGSDYEDSLGKLYATIDMCEKENKPTIITFDKKSPKTAKLVTFELTTRVVIDADGDDDAAIEEAINKFKRGETNGVCFDTCVNVQDDTECPYEE
jgi:hypothetical protein